MNEYPQHHPWRDGHDAAQPSPTWAAPQAFVPAARPRRHRLRLGLAAVAVSVAATGGVVVAGASSGSSTAGTAALPGNAGTAGAATAVPATDATRASGTVSSAAAAVTPGVVDITTRLGYQNAAAAGTGMVLSSTGEILTNNHVVDGATSITVTLVSTGRSYSATVVGTAPSEDVAVLQLQGASGLAAVPIGQSSAVAAGQSVVAIGNAGGKGGAPAVVSGSVTATGQTITASDESGANAEQLTGLIETDADIVAGDSGGPLATLSGTVIGMDTAASSANNYATQAHQGYAIPIAHALAVAQQIESGTASSTVHIGTRGFIGVSVGNQSQNGYGSGYGGYGDDGTGNAAGASAVSGASVSGVVSGGPAAAAGLQAGDVITTVNGSSVSSASDLTTLLQQTRAGQRVGLAWTDAQGQTHTATITLATGPAD